MGCCGDSNKTTGDPETDDRQTYIKELQSGMKNFNASIKETMDAYRSLLSTLEKISMSYNTIANHCSNYVKKPVSEFRDGMRALKETGGFVEFDKAVHTGTVAVMEPISQLLKDSQKSLDELKSKKKSYDSHRSKVEKMENNYAKKNKSLAGSSSYEKECKKRDSSQAEYEKKKQQFTSQVERMKQDIDYTLLSSMNNYLHSTATFCGYLEHVMNGFRTDNGSNDHTSALEALKRKAESESMSRRRLTNTSNTGSREVIKGQSSTADSRAPREQVPYPTEDTPAVPGTYPPEQPATNPYSAKK